MALLICLATIEYGATLASIQFFLRMTTVMKRLYNIIACAFSVRACYARLATSIVRARLLLDSVACIAFKRSTHDTRFYR